MELTGSHEDFPDDGGGESSTGNKKIYGFWSLV